MKKINLLVLFSLCILLFHCSSDNNDSQEANEKRLTQSIYSSANFQNIDNIIYDNNGNVIEFRNQDNILRTSLSYNNQNQIILKEFYEYDNESLYAKESQIFSYNSANKITHIEETYTSYNLNDGSINNQYFKNISISHSESLIIADYDDGFNTKVEFGMSNDLITSIKIYKSNILKSNMSFSYDSNGNCISGTGPINEGSLNNTTDNINLTINYGDEEKHQIFNLQFWHNIFTYTSFTNIRRALTEKHGNRYPTHVEWFQYSDYIHINNFDNVFDEEGYITQKTHHELPGYPNSYTVNYTWD